jgi:hypothetical protein
VIGNVLLQGRRGWHRVDRDVVTLPDVVVDDVSGTESYGDTLPRLLRPVVDAMWQAGSALPFRQLRPVELAPVGAGRRLYSVVFGWPTLTSLSQTVRDSSSIRNQIRPAPVTSCGGEEALRLSSLETLCIHRS